MAALYLLTLDGCPASDSTARVCQLWAGVLWPRKAWHQDADTGVIRAAFVSLCNSCKRWPAPAMFLEHLPQRPKPVFSALMDRHAGRDRENEAFAAMRAQFRELEIFDLLPVHVQEAR